MISNTITIEL